MKRISTILLAISFMASCGKKEASQESIAKYTIYHNGEIITMENESNPTVESVVTKGDVIVYTGMLKDAKNQYPKVQSFDLKGKTMLPGLIEPHFHPGLGAILLPMHWLTPEDWDLGSVKKVEATKNKNEFLTKVKTLVNDWSPGDSVINIFGYSQFFHGSIYKRELDSISSEVPIVIFHRSFHENILNSAGLEYFGYNRDNMDDHQADFDKGIVVEAFQLLDFIYKRWAPKVSIEQWEDGMNQVLTLMKENGITTSHDPGGSMGITPEQLAKTYELFENKPARCYISIDVRPSFVTGGIDGSLSAIKKLAETNTNNIIANENQIKLFIDGGMFSQAMMLSKPYTDGHKGEYITTPSALYDLWKPFWNKKISAHIHVNGDAAVDDLFAIIIKLQEESPWPEHRTVFEHFGVSRPQQSEEMKKLGISASVNAYYPIALSENFAQTGVGPKERSHYFSRNGSLVKNDIKTSFHSDFPMAPPSPLYLAWCAVNRVTQNGNVVGPEEKVTPYQALKAITIDAAYSIKKENTIGSITPGKKADFTILNNNPLTVAPMKIKDVEVKWVVFEGAIFPVNN